MNNLTIALAAVGLWLALGVVFMSMCRAASRADQEMDEAVAAAKKPLTLRQHVFAVRARSLRSMRRLAGGRGSLARSSAAREPHAAHAGLRSAH